MQAIVDVEGDNAMHVLDWNVSNDMGSLSAITIVPCRQNQKVWLQNHSGAAFGARGDMVLMGFRLHLS